MSRLPLYLYLTVYVVTCLIGGVFLLSSETFTGLVQLFTGVDSFWLSSEDVFVNIVLLFAAPGLLVLGYEIALRRRRKNSRTDSPLPAATGLAWIVIPWAGALAVSVVSLARGGAFENLHAWIDYRQWVLSRWQLFDTLTFLEFVNIYNFLPVATILLILRVFDSSYSRARQILVAAAATVPALLIDLMIFQKKTLLVFVILAVLSVLTYQNLLSTVAYRRAARSLVLTGGVAYLLYCVLVTAPTLRKQAHAMAGQPAWLEARSRAAPGGENRSLDRIQGPASQQSPRSTSLEQELLAAKGEPILGPTGKLIIESPRRRFVRSTVQRLFPPRWVGMNPASMSTLPQLSRGPALFFYALLGPLVRTSMPALAYPAVYPRRLPFYGLDVGLDLVGLGQMPRDNIYVHQLLWPTIHGGTVMVPLQFAFYSQVGLGGALILSAAVGYAVALTWIWLLGISSERVRALACALMLILAIYLAGDSLRNSLLASYGVLWGGLFLAGWYALVQVLNRIHLPTHVSLRS